MRGGAPCPPAGAFTGVIVRADQHVGLQRAGLSDRGPHAHVDPVDELQVPAVTNGQLDRAVQAAGQVISRVGEALDELADGLLVHSPSVDTGHRSWQDRSTISAAGGTQDPPRCTDQRPGTQSLLGPGPAGDCGAPGGGAGARSRSLSSGSAAWLARPSALTWPNRSCPSTWSICWVSSPGR